MPGIAIIDGQSGAGKTTLIERLLESNKSRAIQVSRCLVKPGLRQWQQEYASESGKPGAHDKDLRRCLDAGAILATVLTHDPERIDLEDLLLEAADGFDEWDEWLVEAENAEYSRARCSVYVLRPLPESASLVEEIERVVDRLPLADYLRYTCGLLPEEHIETDDEEILEEIDLDVFPDALGEKLVEAGVELSEPEKNRLTTLVKEGVPVWSKQPELRADCSRLLAAEVVVVNLHDERELPRADATRAQILKLYGNWPLRYQIPFRSRVTRPGVYLANLRDPSDSQLQKALAQIKRKLRQR
jgi:hypothetical protein